MFILCAGMEKSGSRYFYEVLKEIIILKGGMDGQEVAKKYRLGKITDGGRKYLKVMNYKTLIKLCIISLFEGDFVLKTHKEPTRAISFFNRLGLIKIYYTFRDPRDALLSAIDHGKRIIENKKENEQSHVFVKMYKNQDQAAMYTKPWTKTWKKYNDEPHVIMVKYEEIIQDTDKLITLFERTLRYKLDEKTKKSLIMKYSLNKVQSDFLKFHYNKGISYRYKTEMSSKVRKQCLIEFGDELEQMGYSE
ncbi:MAG: sulfotransferase domain-containing protein [Leptospirales bacterium]